MVTSYEAVAAVSVVGKAMAANDARRIGQTICRYRIVIPISLCGRAAEQLRRIRQRSPDVDKEYGCNSYALSRRQAPINQEHSASCWIETGCLPVCRVIETKVERTGLVVGYAHQHQPQGSVQHGR